MTEYFNKRARRPRRARFRRFVITVARSWLLESLIRTFIIMLIVFGTLMTGWGLLSEVGSFSSDLSQLVQFAGSGDAVVTSTLDLFRRQVLVMMGLAKPVVVPEEELAMLPHTGMDLASPTPESTSEAGFLPYQVPVRSLDQKEAPPLPTARPSPQANIQAPATETANAETAHAVSAPTPSPTATPAPPAVPGWIIIPRIGLDAPIVVSHTKMVEIDGQTFAQWEAPNEFAAGWQEQSALLGEPGNTVLNGHHNIYGKVFARLHELEQYDEIILYSGDREFRYLVSQVMKVEERDASLEQRQANARWIMHSSDERLTLVTCWPPTSNTYRIIVVAVPVK